MPKNFIMVDIFQGCLHLSKIPGKRRISAADMTGSVHNDPYCLIDDKIKTVTNNHGGIIGGLTSGKKPMEGSAASPESRISCILCG